MCFGLILSGYGIESDLKESTYCFMVFYVIIGVAIVGVAIGTIFEYMTSRLFKEKRKKFQFFNESSETFEEVIIKGFVFATICFFVHSSFFGRLKFKLEHAYEARLIGRSNFFLQRSRFFFVTMRTVPPENKQEYLNQKYRSWVSICFNLSNYMSGIYPTLKVKKGT